MFQFISILISAGGIYFLSSIPLSGKIVLIVLSLLSGVFVDKYVAKEVPFFRSLTVAIMVSLGIFILSMISILLDIRPPKLTGITKDWAEAFMLYLFFITVYSSIRTGAGSNYFRKKMSKKSKSERSYLVDTSAIIDGRLLEIAKTGFIPHLLVIPQFVIQELQLISDSHLHEKRMKGRRGLDLLKQMKNSDDISLKIIDEEVLESKNVDGKLLAMARKDNYSIITTDYNLVKVGQVENIQTMNINHIATVLKPSLSSSDRLKVQVAKKGNNKNQGVAFLPDDTMIIIEDGERYIGQQRNILITSFIQNESGRIAFARIQN